MLLELALPSMWGFHTFTLLSVHYSQDRMKTSSGLKIAQGRHDAMEAYLKQFKDECEGIR